MVWIISKNRDIAVDSRQLRARHDYIEMITGAETTLWKDLALTRTANPDYLICKSYDNVPGTLITAHIDQVILLCSLQQIANCEMVVANTCIWDNSIPKELLYGMKRINSNAELWFAKQELCLDSFKTIHQSTVLSDYGCFGFQSSLSERNLFRYRRLGLRNAIEKSFDWISPVLLPGD